MKTVLTFLGTRPEIIKLSPILPLLRQQFRHILVHSGQHYSAEMDAVFFNELEIPAPDYALGVGSASHGEQTARMLSGLEPILLSERPDAVLVQGDTNTTLAGGLAAAKLGIPVVHLEAGCRSFNRAMPEELNRVVVDHLATLLLAPDTPAEQNLLAEGIPAAQIRLVGSTSIDAVGHNLRLAARSKIVERLEVQPGGYLALTLHRAENTTAEVLPGIIRALGQIAAQIPIIFPIHPRTAATLERLNLKLPAGVTAIEPLGYLDTLALVRNAAALLTDSGGLQEESAALGIPALVLRQETEWRYLTDAGVHLLAGNTFDSITAAAQQILDPQQLAALRAIPAPIWPGASARTAQAIAAYLETTRT